MAAVDNDGVVRIQVASCTTREIDAIAVYTWDEAPSELPTPIATSTKLQPLTRQPSDSGVVLSAADLGDLLVVGFRTRGSEGFGDLITIDLPLSQASNAEDAARVAAEFADHIRDTCD